MTGRTRRLPAKELLLSSDPLSDDACLSLICYREEDDLVDFKEAFEHAPNSKSWIELAIDCSAFANTHGGYLVFGIRNRTWDQVGLTDETVSALTDIKKVLEKINRGLAPPITAARSRRFQVDGKDFVIIAVPSSRNQTHIFETELSWKNPKGDSIRGVRQGAIYVRRSGSNSILTATDFEQLIDRRISQFRDKVLSGIARVINAGPAHETLTVALDVTTSSTPGVKVIDAPPSLDLEGKSLTLRTDSISDKINILIALTRGDVDAQIDLRLLFGLYSVRNDTALNDEQREWVIHHSLREEVPSFYWLKQVKEAKARELISAAFNTVKFWRQVSILNYAGFYGERQYTKLYEKLGEGAIDHGIRKFRSKQTLFNTGPSKYAQRDASRATELAVTLSKGHDAQSKMELEKLDCALYAPFE